jgi:hypothetical protein
MQQDGWFPAKDDAPMFQNLFKNGLPIGQVVKTSIGWTPYTLRELNTSKTAAKPLNDALATREEAQHVVENYEKDSSI